MRYGDERWEAAGVRRTALAMRIDGRLPRIEPRM